MKFSIPNGAAITLLALMLGEASAAPAVDSTPNLSKRGMNMGVFEEGRTKARGDPVWTEWYNSKQAILNQAQKDAVTIAKAAIEEIDSDSSDRLIKLYFDRKNRDEVKARVRAVYERITGGNNGASDGTGSTLVAEIRPNPQTAPAALCLQYPSSLLAVTNPTKGREGFASMILCPLFWQAPKPLAEVVAKCKKDKPKEMSYKDMLSFAGVLVHEYTHYNPIGRANTGLGDVVDREGQGQPYGLEASRGMVHAHNPLKKSEAELNADNYNWFAMHAYMERQCGSGGKRVELQ